MSRKPKAGYFVKGQFVALGSEMDLALRAEAKGETGVSKTDLKRASDHRQAVGTQLCELRGERFNALLEAGHVPDKLADAIVELRRITNFEGKRRQEQFVGKLMRQLDDEQLASIESALDEQHHTRAEASQALHELEAWRERLLRDDAAQDDWFAQHGGDERQQLRALVRQARKDAGPNAHELAQGQWPRHSKAFRELFQWLKAHREDPPA